MSIHIRHLRAADDEEKFYAKPRKLEKDVFKK